MSSNFEVVENLKVVQRSETMQVATSAIIRAIARFTTSVLNASLMR